MPLYEYQCTACAHRFDQIRKLGARAPRCPACGAPTRKQISSPAIQFKGTGWYLTDYARKGKSGGSESGGSESGGSGSSEGKPASDSKSSEGAGAGGGTQAADPSPAGKSTGGKGSKGASSD